MLGIQKGTYGVVGDAKKEMLAVYLIGILCAHYFWAPSDSQVKYILTSPLCC